MNLERNFVKDEELAIGAAKARKWSTSSLLCFSAILIIRRDSQKPVLLIVRNIVTIKSIRHRVTQCDLWPAWRNYGFVRWAIELWPIKKFRQGEERRGGVLETVLVWPENGFISCLCDPWPMWPFVKDSVITSPFRTRSFMRHKVSGNSRTYTWLFTHAFLHCLCSAPKRHSYSIVTIEPILRPISDANVVQMMTKCSILQNFKLWLKKLMQKLKFQKKKKTPQGLVYATLCGGPHPQVSVTCGLP